MNKNIDTDKAPPAFSQYSQAVETPTNARWLHISGQVGVTVNGELHEDAGEQHRQAWRNLFAILNEAGMTKEDMVDVLAIVTDQEQVAIYRKIRDEMLDGHRCASTLLVCDLAHPDWKVEIAVKAAKSET